MGQIAEKLYTAEEFYAFVQQNPDKFYELIEGVIYEMPPASSVSSIIAATLVRLIWVVYPETRTVDVHSADGTHILTESDFLDGEDVLPGFKIAINAIFPE